jgi:hypothetical protein
VINVKMNTQRGTHQIVDTSYHNLKNKRSIVIDIRLHGIEI